MSVDNVSTRSKSPNPTFLGADLNDNLIREFNKKRGTIKGRLTLYVKYVTTLGTRLSENQITELKLRSEVAKTLLNEFNSIQSSIEELVPESDISQQLENREAFETSYYQVQATVVNLLAQSSTSSSISSIEAKCNISKCNVHSLVKLPTISLPSFDGSYDNWLEFRDTFLSMIHKSKQLDDIQKFHYLRSSLKGNAAQVIKSVEFTYDNYTVAWDLLTNRYDNSKLLVHNHVKSLFSMQTTKESSFHIRKLIDTVLKNLRALKTLGEPTESWDTLVIYIVVSKLDAVVEKDWEQFKSTTQSTQSNRNITLDDLLSFLKDKADTLEMIKAHHTSHSIGNKVIHEPTNKSTQQSSVHSFASTRNTAHKTTRNCKLCDASHAIYACYKFSNMSIQDRLAFVKSQGLCVNCLRSGHELSDCSFGPCRQCNEKHNSLLHGGEFASLSVAVQEPKPNSIPNMSTATILHTVEQSRINIDCNERALETVLLSTAIVEVAGDDNGRYHKARALLDSGSQHCIITEALHKKLNVKSIQSTVQITGIGQLVSQSNQSCDINLKSLHGNYNTRINCIILNRITNSLPSVSLGHVSLDVPKNIDLADPTFHSPSQIDLLIGADYFWDLLLEGRIRLPKGPYLQNTALGWVISGIVYNNKSRINRFQCNFAQTLELNNQLKKFWEIEEISNPIQCLSAEESICEKLFTETTTRVENGRFSVRIPLKEPVETLGDSFKIAESRFLSLERRLEKSSQYKSLYSGFMQEYLSLGHMTHIENFDFTLPHYFLPHHGVLREQSTTTKLRVVFNASQKTSSGISLNDIQMTGPALQNDLFSILMRFRQYKYVACADIEKFFRQIIIHEDQRNLQLILWRENVCDSLGVFRLNVVTYGTASAPYLSIRCVRQLGLQCTDEDVARAILEDLFVDDLLIGHDCKYKLTQLCKNVSDVCLSGCFPLRKWIFNSPDVALNAQACEDKSKCLSLEENCSSRTLGLGWYNISDEFHFVTKINEDFTDNITKRLILSVVSQIYDPLGLLSPIIIVGKILLQKLWLCKLGWDDLVPIEIVILWKRFVQSLSFLPSIRVPRHVLNSDPLKVELHIFTDASESAYGAAAYCRTCNNNCDVTVRLLCSKSRVAPLKPVSIPRLELCGALIGAKLYEKIIKSLRLRFDSVVFWTDSTIVLGWLRMSPHLLKTFVQNRVVEINDLTGNAIWLHVRTKQNPADLVSRGTSLSELCSLSLWWDGPTFLRETVTSWSQDCRDSSHNLTTLPELKPAVVSIACTEVSGNIIDFKRFSNLNRLQRACAYVMRFIHNARTKNRDERNTGSLTVDELDRSLAYLTRQAQIESFPIEYNALIKNLNLKSNRSLSSLNMFLNEYIMRVGGRLVNSSFTYDKKHPKLLCSKHHFTVILFRREHNSLLHAGPQLLLSHIRDSWWPLGGRNLARKTVRQCVKCCRMRGKTLQPVMGNLPKERLTAGFPFLHSGVDYAGPLYILNRKGRGAKLEKCYLCLFVCFATRALHLELVTSLSSEGYILALKRFISRRGKPLQIFSDHGRNFVGAAREFTDFLQNNTQSILDYASHSQIDFRFIPPYTPHFGGLWESGVKSCKHHISRVIGNVNLTYEEFSTVLVQIEAVLNSRPMYPMSSDPSDFTPLTPAHFLIGRPLTTPAEKDITTTALPALSRFKRIEQLRQSFWKRWSMEYISELQRRTKWQDQKEDIKAGTMVLIKEEGLPPLKWRLGRVTGTLFPGRDGVTRVAEIRLASGLVKRAFSRICPLEIDVQDAAAGADVGGADSGPIIT